MRFPSATCFLISVLALTWAGEVSAQQRTFTFMDVQELKRAGSWVPRSDGALMLYTVTTPDWVEASSQSDIHIVSLADGVSSSRRLTFTDDKNETQPTWSPDGSFFVFLSNRDSEESEGNQLYMMRHDGGEAQKITEAQEGVSGFDFSPDGRWLVYRSGESGQEQLFGALVADLPAGEAEQLTEGEAGIEQWDFSPDGDHIYFVRPDEFDEDEKLRLEEGFTVDVKNATTPFSSLWSLDVRSGSESPMTTSESYSVDGFTVSPDGRWISFAGGSTERYERNITQARLYTCLLYTSHAADE